MGVGELPDAALYGDIGSHTLRNLSKAVGSLRIPNLESLGLHRISEIAGSKADAPCVGAYGKMAERSKAKDTTTGHWEMMGVVSDKPFPTYPHGFPYEVIQPFEKAIGKKVLGNKPASGTEIIKELGEEHVKTGSPIVYTSADSVFKIACHEEVIPLEKLYELCQIARKQLTGKHAVGRVIARPFLGTPGDFKRTENRRDFALPPPFPTFLDLAKEKNYAITGIGKIEDIFCHRGLTDTYHTGNNNTSMEKTISLLESHPPGILFTNLVDFDMLYGHRNDAKGYAKALEVFDEQLGSFLKLMKPTDLLMITGDHGCDPTDVSTDHTREYVPILAYSPALNLDLPLGTRETFGDLGATCAEALGVPYPLAGKSFYSELKIGARPISLQ